MLTLYEGNKVGDISRCPSPIALEVKSAKKHMDHRRRCSIPPCGIHCAIRWFGYDYERVEGDAGKYIKAFSAIRPRSCANRTFENRYVSCVKVLETNKEMHLRVS